MLESKLMCMHKNKWDSHINMNVKKGEIAYGVVIGGEMFVERWKKVNLE